MKARENPLAVHRLHALRYHFLEGSWSSFHERRHQLSNRGAVVGPKGSGKTTLMEELEARLQEEGWQVHSIRLNQARSTGKGSADLRFDNPPGHQDFLLLDGAEQLSPVTWRRWRHHTAGAGGLIITAHREGRLPLLHRTATTPALLAALVHELVPGDARTGEDLEVLYRRHAGNIREALFELYDGYAAV